MEKFNQESFPAAKVEQDKKIEMIEGDQYLIPFEYDEIVIDKSEDETSAETTVENREQFLKRLEGMSQEDIETIDFAYDLAKEGHRNQRREGGARYFEHLRAAALILLDEAGIKDKDMICAALLHDSGEDTPLFGNVTKDYDEWARKSKFRLTKVFNERTADMVIALTKPSIEGIKFHNKEEGAEFYHHNLENSSAETIILKMADRLHNLRTLGDTPAEKQLKQLKETREVYMPLFQKSLEKFPEAGQIMLDEMNKAMEIIENRIKA